MITIASYLHRERLKELIRRWMYNDLRSSDTGDITRLVGFNHVYVSRYLSAFSQSVFALLHKRPFHTRQARSKGDLKDVIIDRFYCRSSRVTELIANYKHPKSIIIELAHGIMANRHFPHTLTSTFKRGCPCNLG